MSLEAAITELAAAARELTAAILKTAPSTQPGSASEAAAIPAVPAAATGTPEKRGPGRPRKDAAAPAAVLAAANMGIVEGDPEGTSYWVAKDGTLLKIAATGSLTPVADRSNWTQISATDFAKAHAARFPLGEVSGAAPAPAPAAAPSASTAPAAAAPTPSATSTGSPPSYDTVRAALLEISKADPVHGRDRVLSVLAKAQVNTVPELAKATPQTLAAIMADLNPPAAAPAPAVDPLFG